MEGEGGEVSKEWEVGDGERGRVRGGTVRD